MVMDQTQNPYMARMMHMGGKMHYHCTCWIRAVQRAIWNEIWTVFEVIAAVVAAFVILLALGGIVALVMIAHCHYKHGVHGHHEHHEHHGFNLMDMFAGQHHEHERFKKLANMLLPPMEHTEHHEAPEHHMDTKAMESFIEGMIQGLHTPMNATVHSVVDMTQKML